MTPTLQAEHRLTHTILGEVKVGVYTCEDETAVALQYNLDVEAVDPIPVRLHSACLYGEVLWAADCDCRAQVFAAFGVFKARGRGVLIYLNQEGRGAGLVNKAKAYRLQDGEGLDTVEAYLNLGLDPDQRDYTLARGILRDLGIRRLTLLTNNPRKLEQLRKDQLDVFAETLRTRAPSDALSYLRVKQEKLGHDLGLAPPHSV